MVFHAPLHRPSGDELVVKHRVYGCQGLVGLHGASRGHFLYFVVFFVGFFTASVVRDPIVARYWRVAKATNSGVQRHWARKLLVRRCCIALSCVRFSELIPVPFVSQRRDGEGPVEIGFNDDVTYRGSTFHIQTEDHGQNDQRVSTQLFFSGRVLDNQTVSYAHLLEAIANEAESRAKVRKVMVAAHRNVYRRLLNGDYDESLGWDPENAPPREADPASADAFEPSTARVPDELAMYEQQQAAIASGIGAEVTPSGGPERGSAPAGGGPRVLEEDGKVTFTFEHGEQADLSQLGALLQNVDYLPPSDEAGGDQWGDVFGEDEDDGMEVMSNRTLRNRPRPKRRAEPEESNPVLPRYKKTGRRAFQGLLEPPMSEDVLQLVLGYLNGA